MMHPGHIWWWIFWSNSESSISDFLIFLVSHQLNLGMAQWLAQRRQLAMSWKNDVKLAHRHRAFGSVISTGGMKIPQKSHWYFMIFHEKIIKSGKVCPLIKLAHFGLRSSLVKSRNFEALLHLSVLQLTSRYGDVSKRRISRKLPCWWGRWSLKRLDLLVFPVFAQHFFWDNPKALYHCWFNQVHLPIRSSTLRNIQPDSARFSQILYIGVMVYHDISSIYSNISYNIVIDYNIS